MSKFNTTLPKQKTLTENLAGGQAYSQSDELSLVYPKSHFFHTINFYI